MSDCPGTIIVALGGNALSPAGKRATIHDQFHHTRKSLGVVVALAAEGWHIALVHGNGPQVGDELVRNELALEQVDPLRDRALPPLPLLRLVLLELLEPGLGKKGLALDRGS